MMEQPKNLDSPTTLSVARVRELQHKMRNKLGVMDGTFELMHPPTANHDPQEAEDIDRFKRASKSLHDLIEELSTAIT
ncbi:hypothetical protein [Sphingobium sp. B8D3D]|uniref:hypothetical protein n=1 Tax=Sphingobium sp. B8D3D TaxID=2940587 RepID=UPI00222484C5|nr:hypothetical protein [Sphingobium sp. B8D3D]MCW2414218.1 hypothetical protein [Sphingobium sp. B8D3A]